MNNNNISNITIINHTQVCLIEKRQRTTYQLIRGDRCPLLEPGCEATLKFIPQVGLCGAAQGVGADSFFQDKNGSKKFILHWSIPAVSKKPKVRISGEEGYSVEINFDHGNLWIDIKSQDHQIQPKSEPLKLHHKMTEDAEIESKLELEARKGSIRRNTIICNPDLYSNTTDADSSDLEDKSSLTTGLKFFDQMIYSGIHYSKPQSLSVLGEVSKRPLKKTLSHKPFDYFPLTSGLKPPPLDLT